MDRPTTIQPSPVRYSRDTTTMDEWDDAAVPLQIAAQLADTLGLSVSVTVVPSTCLIDRLLLRRIDQSIDSHYTSVIE